MARAATAANIPYILSTVSVCDLKAVTEAAGRPIWFQLYVLKDRAFMRDALERARMEYLPDVNPFAAVTGDVNQVIGVDVMLPTVLPRIKGMVKEARSDLRRVQAMKRQTRLDRAAEYVAVVYALRNSERQAALFEHDVG